MICLVEWYITSNYLSNVLWNWPIFSNFQESQYWRCVTIFPLNTPVSLQTRQMSYQIQYLLIIIIPLKKCPLHNAFVDKGNEWGLGSLPLRWHLFLYVTWMQNTSLFKLATTPNPGPRTKCNCSCATVEVCFYLNEVVTNFI